MRAKHQGRLLVEVEHLKQLLSPEDSRLAKAPYFVLLFSRDTNAPPPKEVEEDEDDEKPKEGNEPPKKER